MSGADPSGKSVVLSLFRGIWKPLNDVFASGNAHDGGSGNFAGWRGQKEIFGAGSNSLPDASLEIAIVRGHDIHAVFDDTVHQTVVGIGTFVVALDSLKPRVFGNAKGETVLLTKFLQFGKHTVGNDGSTFGIETVHHSRNDLELVLNGVGDEVGVD